MIGELFINNKDAYLEWGLFMDETSLSSLMTPAPNKNFIENKSRLQNGKRMIKANPKKNDRNLTLQINFTANNKESFFEKYYSFCKELDTGSLDIKTKYQPDVVYKTIYISCNQFSQFMQGIAKYVLKLNEPDPTDRK
mgnify:CR=1 FL=1